MNSRLKNQKGFVPHSLWGQGGNAPSMAKKGTGFTLAEVLVSMVIIILILIIVSSAFTLNQRVFRKSNIKAELTQNGRIVLDLMAREIRQAKDIVTVLPPDNSNPAAISHQLEFEDGHVSSQIQYIKYYLAGSELMKQVIVYYFDTAPNTYVHWDDVNAFGPPAQKVLEEKIIGENFSNLDFYGQTNITIDLSLTKTGEKIQINSIVNPRNI